jgi:hypothetical protein
MAFDPCAKLSIGHSDAQPIALLHFGTAPDRAARRLVQCNRVTALEHPERRQRVQLRTELCVARARFLNHRPPAALQPKLEGLQAITTMANGQSTRIPELGGDRGELALIASQHRTRIHAHQLLAELGQALSPGALLGTLRLLQLCLQVAELPTNRGDHASRAVEGAKLPLEAKTKAADAVVQRLLQPPLPRAEVAL